jgi:hypothetical protein
MTLRPNLARDARPMPAMARKRTLDQTRTDLFPAFVVRARREDLDADAPGLPKANRSWPLP